MLEKQFLSRVVQRSVIVKDPRERKGHCEIQGFRGA
jgi:hypothetical protein